MRVKLIAIVVAGLFAQSAYADDNFLWSGSIEVGGRGTNIDGVNRNGAVGPPTTSTSPALPTPFTGPVDGAKAQEYQDITSAAIGVVDIRGSNRAYYLRAFGEEFGRDDMFINIVGGGYGVWKGSIYNNDIPHQYSFNALTPLTGMGSTLLVGPGLPYPQAPNPGTWNTFNYGTQRNLWGANAEFSNKSPWFIRADYNEVKQTGIKPGSGQLGTGSGNGLIEFGVPVDYKTQNTTIEGGYNTKQYGFKLAYIDSKFTDNNDVLQWTNFYMRSGIDYSLLPPDNELKKWSFNGYVKQLPWDSAIIARFTQSKLTNSLPIAGTSLKPTGNTPSGQFIPPGVGNLLTQPYDAATNQNLSTFDGDQKTTTVNVAWNASPLAQLDTRVYYDYYDLKNDSTNVSYRQGSQGTSCGTPPANSATCYQIGALLAPEAFAYTKNSAGFDASWAFNRTNKLLGGFDWIGVDRDLEPAPHTDDYRYWIEYRNTGGWQDLTGRLKYEYFQRRSDIDHSETYNSTNVQPTTVPYYFSPYDVSNYDRNMVKLNVDWTPMPLVLIGFGATWRDTDYKDNYYGRTNDRSEQYDVTASWGDDKLRITGIGNWGKVKFEQDYRNMASGQSPLPGGTQSATTFDWNTQNTQDGWMAAAMVDWAATDKLMMTASYSYGETSGGVDFWSGYYGPTCPAAGCAGGFNGGPLVNYATDNTTTQRFQIKGTYNYSRSWAFTAGYAYEKYEYSDGQMAGYSSFYPYFQNLGSSNISWYTGAFANPGYTTNLFWATVTWKFDPPPPVYVAQKAAEAPKAAPPPPPPPPPAPPPPPPPKMTTLSADELFAFDSAVLTDKAKSQLDKIAQDLNRDPKAPTVPIVGYTDRLGSEAYNLKLSQARADAVKSYLASKGVAAGRLQATGKGEADPVVQCTDKNHDALVKCLAPNRRVVIGPVTVPAN